MRKLFFLLLLLNASFAFSQKKSKLEITGEMEKQGIKKGKKMILSPLYFRITNSGNNVFIIDSADRETNEEEYHRLQTWYDEYITWDYPPLKSGIYNGTLNRFIRPQFDFLVPTGQSFIARRKDLFYFIDSDLNISEIKNVAYLKIAPDRILAKKDGRVFMWDFSFKEIPLSGVYKDFALTERNTKIAEVMNDGTAGFVELSTGKEIIPLVITKINPDETGPQKSIQIQKGDKTGYLIVSGKDGLPEMLVAPEWDDVDKTYLNDMLIVKKSGKYGLIDSNGILQIKPEFENINVTYPRSFFLIGNNQKYGLLDAISLKEVLPIAYDTITISDSSLITVLNNGRYSVLNKSGRKLSDQSYQRAYPFNNYYADSVYVLKKEGKTGLVNVFNNKILAPFEYDSITDRSLIYNAHEFVKNGKIGLINENTYQIILSAEWDHLTRMNDSVLYAIGNGKLTIMKGLGQREDLKSLADEFQVKWKVKTGMPSFRTNIIEEKGKIYFGSNGRDRNSKNDDLDGVFIIDARKGEIVNQLKDDKTGDNDVNGVGISSGRVYFGNDNYQFFCFSEKGKKLWEYKTAYDTETCPVLTDLNGDKIDDVVFSTENTGITALDGNTGKELWKNTWKGRGGYMNSPAALDITGDGIADIFAGVKNSPVNNNGGTNSNYCCALNGKDGSVIWAFAVGSNIHASALVSVNGKDTSICFAQSYSPALFFNTKGEIIKYVNLPDVGQFSSPVLSEDQSTLALANSWFGGFSDAIYTSQLDTASFNIDSEGLRNISPSPDKGIPAGRVSATAAVADIMGTGKCQFIYPTEAGELILMNEKGDVLKRLGLPAGTECTPLVKDVDGDGFLELLIADNDGILTCYKTKSKGKIHWGQFRGDNKNTGLMK